MSFDKISNVDNEKNVNVKGLFEKLPEIHKNNSRYLFISLIPDEDGEPYFNDSDNNLIAYGINDIPTFVFASIAILSSGLDLQINRVLKHIIQKISDKLISEVKHTYNTLYEQAHEDVFATNEVKNHVEK